MIKAFLRAKYKEDGRLLWNGIIIAIIILAFLARGEAAAGLAVLIAGIYFGAWFVSSFHVRCNIDMLLSGCGCYQKQKPTLYIAGTLRHNLPLGLAVFTYISLACGKVNCLCLFYTLTVYLFANGVGMLAGVYIKKTAGGLLICSVASAVNFVKILTLEQTLRFFSPVVQIGNLKVFQWWNLLSLIVMAAVMYGWVLAFSWKWKRYLTAGIGLLCMAVIIFADITVTGANNKVPMDYEAYARKTLEYVNQWNVKCGFTQYENIVIYKSVYYPWMPSDYKAPIYIRDQTIYMNCFTESLCNLEDREIITRAVNSLLKPKPGAQNVMASFYQQWLLREEQNVYRYLESAQIEQAGRVYNPFYKLAAEVLIYEPERYGEMYLLAGECDTREEVIERWEKNNDSFVQEGCSSKSLFYSGTVCCEFDVYCDTFSAGSYFLQNAYGRTGSLCTEHCFNASVFAVYEIWR